MRPVFGEPAYFEKLRFKKKKTRFHDHHNASSIYANDYSDYDKCFLGTHKYGGDDQQRINYYYDFWCMQNTVHETTEKNK